MEEKSGKEESQCGLLAGTLGCDSEELGFTPIPAIGQPSGLVQFTSHLYFPI